MQQFKCYGASINIKNLIVQIQPTDTQRGISKMDRRERTWTARKVSTMCTLYAEQLKMY